MDVYCKRKAEGLTQWELAKKLGISLDTLSKIEKGHEKLRTKVKAIIDDYLNEEW
ncbi:helix-turn-helix transcriptional regulator [Bacillus anthracis]|nr:helix-turn-helix transcriptional regulator [Bacillus anthracis]